MSGEFITVAEATRVLSRPICKTPFCVDLTHLQAYILESEADQIYIQKGINDDYSETLVITCYKAGAPVYHVQDGVNCVLEHILPA